MAIQTVGINNALPPLPRGFMRNGVIDQDVIWNELVENNVLREDSTVEIEEAMVGVARRRLRAVADLRASNLTVNLRDVGVTSWEYDKIAPVGEATQSMSILNLGDRDLVDVSRTSIPVPVTASQFEMDARLRAAGDRMGTSMSLVNVEEHTRSVAEKLEDTLVNGSDVVLGTNVLQGYTDFTCRQQASFSNVAWDASGFTGSDAVTDVLALRTLLRDDGFSGPYVLYIPSNFEAVIDEDFKSESDRTTRDRLLAIEGVTDVRVLPTLPDDNVLLVEMSRSVVEMAIGQDLTVVTWDIYGGLGTRWAILGVITFGLKCANTRAPLRQGTLPALTTGSGIAHLS